MLCIGGSPNSIVHWRRVLFLHPSGRFLFLRSVLVFHCIPPSQEIFPSAVSFFVMVTALLDSFWYGLMSLNGVVDNFWISVDNFFVAVGCLMDGVLDNFIHIYYNVSVSCLFFVLFLDIFFNKLKTQSVGTCSFVTFHVWMVWILVRDIHPLLFKLPIFEVWVSVCTVGHNVKFLFEVESVVRY